METSTSSPYTRCSALSAFPTHLTHGDLDRHLLILDALADEFLFGEGVAGLAEHRVHWALVHLGTSFVSVK